MRPPANSWTAALSCEGGENMEKQYIVPVVGRVYTNRNGGDYLCTGNLLYLSKEEERRSLALGEHIAYMERVKDGWSLSAHGVVQYENGTIEWNYSTNGRFPF